MLIDKRLRRITEKELGHDEQSNIFFAVEGLLKDVAPVTVHREFNDTTSKG